jgi:hypothetical protein
MIGVEDLVVLFVGEPGDWDAGEWVTRPTYSAKIAEEVARRVEPVSEVKLREVFFGDWAPDDIELEARQAISSGYAAWRKWQREQARSRGL